MTHLGNGYRAYSPALRRFTCPDSDSPFGIGGINPYVYCDHDPVNRTDPSGHAPKKGCLHGMFQSLRTRMGLGKKQRDAMNMTVDESSRPARGTSGSALRASGTSQETIIERQTPTSLSKGMGLSDQQEAQSSQMADNHPASQMADNHPATLPRNIPEDKNLTNILDPSRNKPKPALKMASESLLEVGAKKGVSTESQRRRYHESFKRYAKEIEEKIVDNSPGRNLGPTRNAISKSSELLHDAIDKGYPIHDIDVQNQFSYFVLSYVTDGFEGEETNGTLIGDRSKTEFGGFMDLSKMRKV